MHQCVRKRLNHNRKEYEKECMSMYNGITLLYSRNEHNIVNQLYLNKIIKKKTKRNSVLLLNPYQEHGG